MLLLNNPVADSFYKFCCPNSTKNFCDLRKNAVVHLIQRFSNNAKQHNTFYHVLLQSGISDLLNVATEHVERLDGALWRNSRSSFELQSAKNPPAAGEELNLQNGSLYRANVLSLAWGTFSIHYNSQDDLWFPSLHDEAWRDVPLEQVERDHIYSWIT
ncbi:hypothetical protein BDP27DRAFT_1040339 [Rhodocollybia butyracea]|uniref:Uncharacterized protein n=1 Tax=Rhodocollybia butyracea TaxID=206335 RepID=A0A9P5Q6K5_9AGAR|nr:hypothetical protein BDP27DRAFT_1040339 [Rhodocollybia butyracea]